MGTLKNISPEDLDVPVLRRTVEAGEAVEVDDALLTNPDLCWPSQVWEVNGGTHEYDPNSPENIAKAEAQRIADEEGIAKAVETGPSVPLPVNPAANPTPDGGSGPNLAAPATEVTGN